MIHFHLRIFLIFGWQQTTPSDRSTVDFFLRKDPSVWFKLHGDFHEAVLVLAKAAKKGNAQITLTKLEYSRKKMALEVTRWDYNYKWSNCI